MFIWYDAYHKTYNQIEHALDCVTVFRSVFDRIKEFLKVQYWFNGWFSEFLAICNSFYQTDACSISLYNIEIILSELSIFSSQRLRKSFDMKRVSLKDPVANEKLCDSFWITLSENGITSLRNHITALIEPNKNLHHKK